MPPRASSGSSLGTFARIRASISTSGSVSSRSAWPGGARKARSTPGRHVQHPEGTFSTRKASSNTRKASSNRGAVEDGKGRRHGSRDDDRGVRAGGGDRRGGRVADGAQQR